MQQGDIVVERLTGKHVMVLKIVNGEYECRFADGRIENRNAFELADLSFGYVQAQFALAAGMLAGFFDRLRVALAVVTVPPLRPLALVARKVRRAGLRRERRTAAG